MADTSAPKSPEKQSEAKQLNRARFELELEFVQALANPYYLHSLAQQGILSQPSFVNYLKYLQYWKKREYARFLQYVDCRRCVYMLNKRGSP
jgi:mediator of RNA polymerase II transcription subunit 31